MFGIVVLAVYAALMIGVTLIFTRRATNAESFHVADRRIGATSAAMSIAATWIWAPVFVYVVRNGLHKGIAGDVLVPGAECAVPDPLYPVRKTHSETIPGGHHPDRLHDRKIPLPEGQGAFTPSSWGRWPSFRQPCSSLPGGKTLALLTGLPFWSMTLALAAIAYSYSRFSGIKASVATDVVQLGIILLGGALLVTLGLRLTGGLETVRAGLGSVSGEYISLTSVSRC